MLPPAKPAPILWCNAVFSGIAALAILIAAAAIQVPTFLDQAGISQLLTVAGAIIAFGLAAWWVRRSHSESLVIAAISGLLPGMLFGASEMLSITFETSSTSPRWLQQAAPPISMSLMVLLFGIAGSLAYRRTASLVMSAVGGLACAIVGILLTCIFGFAHSLLFMPYLEQITRSSYLRSGMSDPHVFVLLGTLESASTHILLAPLLALLFSMLGGFVTGLLQSASRALAGGVAFLALLQLGVGVGSLLHAASLIRPQRPPFVMFGMLACGTALAYLYPAMSATLRRPQWDRPLGAAR